MFADRITFGAHHLRGKFFCSFAVQRFQHDLACDRIVLSRKQVLIDKFVHDNDFLARFHRADSRIGVRSKCMSVREMYRLRSVVNILMHDHFRAVMIHALKHHDVLTGEPGGVKIKGEGKSAVFLFGSEHGSIVRYGNDSGGALCKCSSRKHGGDLTAGILPHHASLNGILFSGDQIPVDHRVDDAYFFIRH